tara:strand:+ start:1197 stop:1811 length:615 start_codon:yes stop_codon:yes gene_type:complete
MELIKETNSNIIKNKVGDIPEINNKSKCKDTQFFKYEDYNLNNNFKLWFHNANDKNWNIESYNEIQNFDNIIDILEFNNLLEKFPLFINNGMVFFMRENIKPIWEDENNINGGCISWKIEKQEVLDTWINLIELLISNELNELDKYIINGISISPKRSNNILKIWIGKQIDNEELKKINLGKHFTFDDNCRLFKSHQDNIKKDG